jgi:hypothetical protein
MELVFSELILVNTLKHEISVEIRTGNFYLHYHVQNCSGPGPTSYPVGSRGSFPGGKVAGAWSWSSAELKECVKLYLHSSSTPSWRGAQFKKAQGQSYLYILLLFRTEIVHLEGWTERQTDEQTNHKKRSCIVSKSVQISGDGTFL